MATVPMPRPTRDMPGLYVVCGAWGTVTVIAVSAQYLIFRFRGGYSGCWSVRDVRGYAFISSLSHFVWSSLSNVYFYPVSRGVTSGTGPLFQSYPLNLPDSAPCLEFKDWNKCFLVIDQRKSYRIFISCCQVGCILKIVL